MTSHPTRRPVRRRPALTVLAAGALALTLAACTGRSGTAPAATADDEDLGTLTTMVQLFGQAPDPEGELHTAVEEALGKQLDVTWVPNASYGDRLTVTLASDDVPEVISTSKVPAFIQAAEAGAFWDLTDKLGDYPNLSQADPVKLQNSSVNGKVYGIYRDRDLVRATVILRKDWLANVGLEVPTTVDELYEVARAFTQDDPDGNGQDDTYGLVLPKWPGAYGTASPYDVVDTWLGAPNAWGVDDDGTLYPGFDDPAFVESSRWFKRLVDEGLTNPDYATLDAGAWNDPFVQGKGGMIIDVGSRGIQIAGLMPGGAEQVVMTGNLTGPDGELHAYPTPGYNGFLAISKQSVPTETELADVLSTLDRMNDDDLQVLLNNGIEGVNFTLEGDRAKYVDPSDPAAVVTNDAQQAFAQLGMAVSGYTGYLTAQPDPAMEQLDEDRIATAASDAEQAVVNPALALDSPTYRTQGVQLDQVIADARIQFISGQIDEAGLQEAVDRWHSSGGDQVAAELTELYAAAQDG